MEDIMFNFYKGAQGELVIAYEPPTEPLSNAVMLLDPDGSAPVLPHVRYGFTLFPCRRETMAVMARAQCNSLGDASSFESTVGIRKVYEKYLRDDLSYAKKKDLAAYGCNEMLSNKKFKSLRNSYDACEEHVFDYLGELAMAICPSLNRSEVLAFFKLCEKLNAVNKDADLNSTDLMHAIRVSYAEKSKVYMLAPFVRGQFAALLTCAKGLNGLSDAGVKTCDSLLSVYDGKSIDEIDYKIRTFSDDDAVKIIEFLDVFSAGTSEDPADAAYVLGRCLADLGFVKTSSYKQMLAKLQAVVDGIEG